MARHVEHGRALLDGLPPEGRVLDLGSGGGLPGLVVATARPSLELTLLEARQRACRFLREAVADLGLAIEVIEARAEEAARRPALREVFDAVVARSFGPPAITAECAVGFLRLGGHLIVSEPPDDSTPTVPLAPGGALPPQTPPQSPLEHLPSEADRGGVQGGQSPPWGETPNALRWPTDGLQSLGFAPAVREGSREAHFVRLTKARSDDRWPRRVGIPAKRPLWKS